MQRLSCLFCVCLLVIITLSNVASAQSYSYPELNMVPKFSDRLRMETTWEKKNASKMHYAIQASATATLVTGVMMFSDVDITKDKEESSPILGVAVGALWLGLTYYMGSSYRPYKSALRKNIKIKGNGTRARLTRERLAEEEVNSIASMGRKMKWMAFFSNFLASAYMTSKAESGSSSSGIGTISALMAFTPFMWEYRWERVSSEQQRYKKRIYAPVASTGLLYDSTTKTTMPGMKFSMRF
ncbi:MAG: hypothetical protein ACI9QD_000738 [Thermoproteota archaeon]|jgi:hypothetical protein